MRKLVQKKIIHRTHDFKKLPLKTLQLSQRHRKHLKQIITLNSKAVNSIHVRTSKGILDTSQSPSPNLKQKSNNWKQNFSLNSTVHFDDGFVLYAFSDYESYGNTTNRIPTRR